MSNVDFAQIITPHAAAETTKSRLLQLLSEHRWVRENEGVDVTESANFQSDRTSRAEMTSLLSNLELGTINGPVTWKALSGWEVIGIDQLRQILWLQNAHVQACFEAERLVEAQIIDGKLSDSKDLKTAFSSALEIART